MVKHAEHIKIPLSEEQFLNALAVVVKELRTAQGISHDKLAKMAGVTRPTVSYIESRKKRPTITTCYKIAHALGITLSDLVQRVETYSS